MLTKTSAVILIVLLFCFSRDAFAVTTFSCLQSITSDPDFNNNQHHPENYYFAKVNEQGNQFLLLQQNIGYLCKTDGSLAYDTLIDIFTMVPGLKEPRRLHHYLNSTPREKPQTKSLTVPQEGGFLPAHISMPSAIEITAAGGRNKLVANCTKTNDMQLIDKNLQKLATAEIEDLYADFADQRDALAYNYDLKEVDKKNVRKQFDLKLKKVIELCAAVPELTSVSAAVSRKINLKADVLINIPLAATNEAPEKKDKLHSDVKQ